jgi:hypothetical protein
LSRHQSYKHQRRYERRCFKTNQVELHSERQVEPGAAPDGAYRYVMALHNLHFIDCMGRRHRFVGFFCSLNARKLRILGKKLKRVTQ